MLLVGAKCRSLIIIRNWAKHPYYSHSAVILLSFCPWLLCSIQSFIYHLAFLSSALPLSQCCAMLASLFEHPSTVTHPQMDKIKHCPFTCISVVTPILWNYLPVEIRKAPTVLAFCRLCSFIQEGFYYMGNRLYCNSLERCFGKGIGTMDCTSMHSVYCRDIPLNFGIV